MIECTATARSVAAAVPAAVAVGVGAAVHRPTDRSQRARAERRWSASTSENHAEPGDRTHPIFVDSTDRRSHRIRRTAYAAAAGCVVFLVVLGASVGAGQRTPMFQLPIAASDTGVAAGLPAIDPNSPVTVPGPSVTDPGPAVTDPGPPVTVPGPAVTDPGPPVTVPGPPVTVPGLPVTVPP